MRVRRFQEWVTEGRLTLPVTLLVALVCWLVGGTVYPDCMPEAGTYLLWQWFDGLDWPAWVGQAAGFLLYAVMGYFLIGLNNTFGIIRMRASVQTSVFFLLVAATPPLHTFYAGNVAAAAFLPALFFLFRSYRNSQASTDLFYSFAFIGLGSLAYPQLTLFVPLFWLGAYGFQSLSVRSFCASLVGWLLPYWFLAGHAFFYGQMELLYEPFRELARFQPLSFRFQLWEVMTMACLLVLFVVSAGHCLASGYGDKIRTRSYLYFLILVDCCLFLYALLQPVQCARLLPLLMVGVGVLAGHLFVLSHGRNTNLFFIGTLAGLFILFVFNLWTLS